VRYRADGASAELQSRFANTPLGVFDGSFEATTNTAKGATAYHSVGISTRKTREISHSLDQNGRVTAVSVKPNSQRTALSVLAAVPQSVVNPVTGFGQIVTGRSCPGPIKIYDGRRVAQIGLKSQSVQNGILTCLMDYRVVAGPGHLSPFRFTAFNLTLTYDLAKAQQGPRQIALRTGLFEVVLRR
jgi:hypothetical protein